MSKFSDLLATIGLAPKTLPQAKETIDSAKATLDSVAALFTAAGLNLETMLAAGPDALKAHLDSLDNAEELATALGEAKRLEALLTATDTKLKDAVCQIAAANTILSEIGLSPLASGLTPEKAKEAFSAHVSKQTTLALAKTGHPPAHVPAADTTLVAAKSDADLAKEYEALPRGEAKSAFYAKHEQALWRHEKSTRNRAE